MAQYTVKKGDSPWAIAVRLLGDGRRWKEILKANGLNAKSVLQPGQRLEVGKGKDTPPTPRLRPGSDTAPTKPPAGTPAVATKAAGAPGMPTPTTSADFLDAMTNPAKQAALHAQEKAEAADLLAKNNAEIDAADAARAAARKPPSTDSVLDRHPSTLPGPLVAGANARYAADQAARDAAKAKMVGALGPGGSPILPKNPDAVAIENATGGAFGAAKRPADVSTANSPFAAGIDRLPSAASPDAGLDNSTAALLDAARARGVTAIQAKPMGTVQATPPAPNLSNANLPEPLPSPANAAASAAVQRSLSIPGSANPKGIDPRLVDVAQQAAETFPLRVEVTAHGGKNARSSGTPNHPGGWAMDFVIYGQDGKALDNFHDPKTFRTYEQYAQKMRQIQMKKYPELDDTMRFGGYFGGGHAFDQMHIDITPSAKGAMSMGSWDGGLNATGKKYLPNANSVGLANGGADEPLVAAKDMVDHSPNAGKAVVVAAVKPGAVDPWQSMAHPETTKPASTMVAGPAGPASASPTPAGPDAAAAENALAKAKQIDQINMLAMIQQSMKKTAPIAAPPALTPAVPLDPSKIWPVAANADDYPTLQRISDSLYL